MLILIDAKTLEIARLINQAVERDGVRNYYLLAREGQPDALLVLRAGVDIAAIRGAVCDCAIGNDTAMAGFAREEEIGQVRTKVTVFRAVATDRPARSLRQIISDRRQS